MPDSLKTVLERLNSRLNYRNKDKTALDISRSLAAGNLGNDKQYTEWAALADDPLVVANYVSTFVNTLCSKLTSAPFRPENGELYDIGSNARLNASFNELFLDVLNDGYAFAAIGMRDGMPVFKPVDARYIIFNGDCPTLSDATDVAIFEIIPRPLDEDQRQVLKDMDVDLIGYVDYDSTIERVIVSHYHKGPDGVTLTVYENYDQPEVTELTNLDRIPVVRFVGSKVELADKRYHYRGIYYTMQTVLKAMSLTGTKINCRAASSDDDNYIVRSDAIANDDKSWDNSGAKTIANIDNNGNDIPAVQFVPHDNEFLITAFNLWKNVISDMLGPTVASGSEAVTREEVVSRNEVKEALANIYLSKMADSIEEVYRIIQMYNTGNTARVVIVGGFIDNAKKEKQVQRLVMLRDYAEKSGLNTQEFVRQMVDLSDLPTHVAAAITASFEKDPFKSPQVLQLQQTIEKLNKTIQQQQTQIALLRLQATQRLERQKEFIDSTERTKRLELALKQWQTEQQQNQEARMALLQDAIATGDYAAAISIMDEIRQESNPIITDNIINLGANAFAAENAKSVNNALESTAAPPPPANGMPLSGAQAQTANPNAPALRPAVTTFNDA